MAERPTPAERRDAALASFFTLSSIVLVILSPAIVIGGYTLLVRLFNGS